MHLIDVTEAAARELIAAVAGHLPPGASLGRILFATSEHLVTAYGDTGEATSGIDDAGAWRQGALGGGEHEIARWYWGTEESRRIVWE